jgi:hypothetical protein
VESRDTKIAITAAAVAKMERKKAQGGDSRTQKQGSPMRLIFGIFPLLVIPVILYNLLALGAGSPETTNAAGQLVSSNVAPLAAMLAETAFSLPMISGVDWVLTKGDAIVLLAVTFLFLEILKSTSTGTATIINHGISLMLFIICLVQFLLMPNFATSTFFILMSMTLLDVLAGVIVTIVSARRDFGVGGDV